MIFLARIAPEVAALTGWLITLLAHSALCCAVALAAAKWMVSDPHSRDRLWKLALVAPLVTATFSTILASRYPDRALSAASIFSMAQTGSRVDVNVNRTTINGVETVSTRRSDLDGLLVIAAFSAFVLGTATLSLLRFAKRRCSATHAIAGRQILSRGCDDWSSVPTFIARRPLLLSLSSEISSPVALGRNEICLPAKTFGDLTSSQRHSILRHEVAHLERRDPEWMLLGQVIAGALVVQPLCRLVLERMRRDAEFICDDKAVGGRASPRALAESLAILSRPFDSLASATLGSHYSSSPIVERAERLLRSQTHQGASHQARSLRTTLAATLACTVLAISPGLTLADTSRSEKEVFRPSARPMLVTDEKEVLLDSHWLNIRH